jgi:hypothetical protein
MALDKLKNFETLSQYRARVKGNKRMRVAILAKRRLELKKYINDTNRKD